MKNGQTFTLHLSNGSIERYTVTSPVSTWIAPNGTPITSARVHMCQLRAPCGELNGWEGVMQAAEFDALALKAAG